jgi:ATP-binding cassette, subfamily B (MDR/TAP), member 1
LAQTVATLVIGIVLSLYFSWKLGLVTVAFVPIVFFAVVLESRVSRMQSAFAKTSLENASKVIKIFPCNLHKLQYELYFCLQVATEAIANIRTVAGLVRERAILQQYSDLLRAPHKKALKMAHIRGIVFGFGQAMPFLAYGISLWYGGYLVHYEGLPYENIIK